MPSTDVVVCLESKVTTRGAVCAHPVYVAGDGVRRPFCSVGQLAAKLARRGARPVRLPQDGRPGFDDCADVSDVVFVELLHQVAAERELARRAAAG